MSLTVACPGCGTQYTLDDHYAGRRLQCKQCAQVFQAPRPAAPTPPPDDGFGSFFDEALSETGPSVSTSTAGPLGEAAPSTLPPVRRRRHRELDEASKQFLGWGGTFAVLGVGSFLLPIFGLQFKILAMLGLDMPIVGTILASVGALCILIGLRHNLLVGFAWAGVVVLGLVVAHAITPGADQPGPRGPERRAQRGGGRREGPGPVRGPKRPTEDPHKPRSSTPSPPPPVADVPAEPAAPLDGPVDLLALIDPERDGIRGQWTVEGRCLVSSATVTALEIPLAPPREYRLTVVAQRLSGPNSLNIGLVVAGRQVWVALEGWGKKISALSLVDGKQGNVNETAYREPVFFDRGPTTIVCTVRNSAVQVTCDGRTIIDWTGNPQRLSLNRRWLSDAPQQRLLLGSWASFRISKLELAPLGGAM